MEMRAKLPSMRGVRGVFVQFNQRINHFLLFFIKKKPTVFQKYLEWL